MSVIYSSSRAPELIYRYDSLFRLLRKGLEFGEKEFADILRVHTSLEARATVYKAWASACRNARLKAEEAGHAGKAQECAEAEQRVLRQAAEQIGTSATECVFVVVPCM